MRPNWSTAVRTAASASERLVTSSVTGNRSFGVPNAFDTASAFRPVATTAWPDASAAFAKSAPIPRPAPVMNHTFLLLTTSPYSACPQLPDPRMPMGHAISPGECPATGAQRRDDASIDQEIRAGDEAGL